MIDILHSTGRKGFFFDTFRKADNTIECGANIVVNRLHASLSSFSSFSLNSDTIAALVQLTRRYTMAETYEERLAQKMSAMRWHKLPLDPFLFFCLLLLAGVGLFIVYSASNADNTLVTQQAVRFGISLVLLCI